MLAAPTQFQPEDDGRKFVVHADNARADTAQSIELLRRKWTAAPRPLYSPLLTPSDFYLFGYVKERLKGMMFPSYEESLDTRRNW
jgi:hypothetical protein